MTDQDWGAITDPIERECIAIWERWTGNGMLRSLAVAAKEHNAASAHRIVTVLTRATERLGQSPSCMTSVAALNAVAALTTLDTFTKGRCYGAATTADQSANIYLSLLAGERADAVLAALVATSPAKEGACD